MKASIEVIVVGGGIAGLTMALNLHQAGIAVRVYEAVREPQPLGLGIKLQPLPFANSQNSGSAITSHKLQSPHSG